MSISISDALRKRDHGAKFTALRSLLKDRGFSTRQINALCWHDVDFEEITLKGARIGALEMIFLKQLKAYSKIRKTIFPPRAA